MSLLEAVEALCGGTLSSSCHGCGEGKRNGCFDVFMDRLAELLGFMVEHFAHEERIMSRLPRNDQHRQSISAHKQAHSDISMAISRCAYDVDHANPVISAAELCALIRGWLDEHLHVHDSHLLSQCAAAGIQLKAEPSAA